MSQIGITDEIVEIIDAAREETLRNAWDQATIATELFSNGFHSSACFLSMTAIEEAGKVGILQFIRGNALVGTPSRIDTDELRSLLADHQGKALRSAATSLCINNRARRIYGTHPDCELDLKDGLLLLARAGNEWMRIRGNCLYTDLDLHAKSISSPNREIDSNYAYYFTCMAGEVVAEVAEAGFGSLVEGRDPSDSIEFWNNATNRIDEFVDEHESDFNPSELDFFTDSRFDGIRESIAERLDLGEEHVEDAIQQTVGIHQLIAQLEGKPVEEIERRTSELRRRLQDSYPENIPSSECMTEFRRLAEDVNTVVSTGDE